MRPYLNNQWENIRSSLWFLPSLLVLFALALAAVSVQVDVILAARQSPLPLWLFSGTPDAGRTILSVIASSLVTVISIAFSITIIALQQASTQFSPRVLRNFVGSRVNQVILGMYVATFLYALVILRLVRSESEGRGFSFVPALSVTVALILAGVCLALLIYFIHHIAQSLQVGVVMEEIHDELIGQIDHLYPSQLAQAMSDPPPADEVVAGLDSSPDAALVRSERAGFLRHVDENALLHAPLEGVNSLHVLPRIGDFVAHGSVLVKVDVTETDPDEVANQLRAAFVIDRTRSIEQDALFGIRQLVDIALKALSPSVNDPTTAEYVLYYVGDAIGRLAERRLPPSIRETDDGRVRIIVNRPTWEDFVEAAFGQIRREAADDVHVTAILVRILGEIAARVAGTPRALAVLRQLEQVRASVQQQEFSQADKRMLLAQLGSVESLRRPVS